MVHPVSHAKKNDRPIAGVIWELESEGWSLAEHLIIRSDGQLTWIVSGFNGPNAIRSQGANMAEAWARAAEQARSSTSGSACLAPSRSPSILSLDPNPDRVSADVSDRLGTVEVQRGRSLMGMDHRGERDGSARPGDKPKPKHRGRRRVDGKVYRGTDHARRTNPHRY